MENVSTRELAQELLNRIQEDAIFGQRAILVRMIMVASEDLVGTDAVKATLSYLAERG